MDKIKISVEINGKPYTTTHKISKILNYTDKKKVDMTFDLLLKRMITEGVL